MSQRGCSNGHRGFYTSCCIHYGDANVIIRVLVSLPVFTIAKGKGAGGGMSHPLCPATSYVRPWPHPLPIASSNSHPEGEPAPGPPRFWQGFFTDDVLQWSHIRIYEVSQSVCIQCLQKQMEIMAWKWPDLMNLNRQTGMQVLRSCFGKSIGTTQVGLKTCLRSSRLKKGNTPNQWWKSSWWACQSWTVDPGY